MIKRSGKTKIKKGLQDKPNPSYVEVPRPNSSIIMRDFSDAPFRMDAVSSISCIKVETPRSCQQKCKAKYLELEGFADLHR